jgi:hypothetical protein
MMDRYFWFYVASLALVIVAGSITGLHKGWWITVIGVAWACIGIYAMIKAKPEPATPMRQIVPPPPVQRPPKTVLVLAQECYCHVCLERSAILHLALAARARESIEEQLGGAHDA